VNFIESHIECISDLPSESFDVIVSNCVVNLSPDKRAVLSEAYRLLKPGGEMYFSDVYSGQRVPAALKKDPVLWGECLSGTVGKIQQRTVTTSISQPLAPQPICTDLFT
jgi:arsenite methyltransferase